MPPFPFIITLTILLILTNIHKTKISKNPSESKIAPDSDVLLDRSEITGIAEEISLELGKTEDKKEDEDNNYTQNEHKTQEILVDEKTKLKSSSNINNPNCADLSNNKDTFGAAIYDWNDIEVDSC